MFDTRHLPLRRGSFIGIYIMAGLPLDCALFQCYITSEHFSSQPQTVSCQHFVFGRLARRILGLLGEFEVFISKSTGSTYRPSDTVDGVPIYQRSE